MPVPHQPDEPAAPTGHTYTTGANYDYRVSRAVWARVPHIWAIIAPISQKKGDMGHLRKPGQVGAAGFERLQNVRDTEQALHRAAQVTNLQLALG